MENPTGTEYHTVNFYRLPGGGFDLVCTCGKALGHAPNYEAAYARAAAHERGEDEDDGGTD